MSLVLLPVQLLVLLRLLNQVYYLLALPLLWQLEAWPAVLEGDLLF